MCKYFGFIEESINEGEGLRSVIFFSGCTHNCKGCHTPWSHNFTYGNNFSQDVQNELIKKMKNNPLLDGLTLCEKNYLFR